jgi:hypothetical protein
MGSETCPNGFEIPQNKHDRGNQYYGKGGCAMSCR